MVNEKQRIEELKQQGYAKVYVWHASPFEEDHEHTHPFDVHLEVVSGEIEIGISGAESAGAKNLLRAGDQFNIPRETKHTGKAGAQGCEYIVAEKH